MLAVPMLLVAITAVLMEHGRLLKLGEVSVPAKWFPGYRGDALRAQQADLKVVWSDGRALTYVGTRAGLFRLQGDSLLRIAAIESRDIKTLTGDEATGVVFAGTREGVYRIRTDNATLVRKGDVHSLSMTADRALLVIPNGKGAERSIDGGATWAAVAEYAAALRTLPLPEPPSTVTLSRLAFDIHVGTAFTGRSMSWLWVDALGLVLAFLVGTGVWLWWVARRRRAADLAASRPTSAPGAWASPNGWRAPRLARFRFNRRVES